MTGPTYMVSNKDKEDPIIRHHFGGIDFAIVQPTIDDLGARIVAEALSQMYDHAYEALHRFDTRGEYDALQADLSNTASELLGMAHGEDDETMERELAAMDEYDERPSFNATRFYGAASQRDYL